MNLYKLFSNKVILYLGSRYITYAIQFIVSLMIAFRLGPEYFGIWSFFLLIINYFNIFDFGLSNSLNVLLVHNRKEKDICNNYVISALFLTGIISLIIIGLYICERIFKIDIISKYQISPYIGYICLIVIFAYFNKIFAVIYRVNNKLIEVAFYQSIIPLLLFLTILICKKGILLFLILSYLVGNILTIIFFICKKEICLHGLVSLVYIKSLSTKGFWLFLYNSSFYLILYISSLLVSLKYSVSDFGKFNFSYTLSHSVILLIDAFGFIIFPKLIAKLKDHNNQKNIETIKYIRINYMTLIHIFIYLSFPIFYYLEIWFPKYHGTTSALCFAALALLPYADCFGLNTYLIAQNLEKKLSIISIFCLILNSLLVYLGVQYVKIGYELVFMCICFSYINYTLLCSIGTMRKLGMKLHIGNIIEYAFRWRNIYVFLTALIIAYFEYNNLLVLTIPLLLYCILNVSSIKVVFKGINTILLKPNVVDL